MKVAEARLRRRLERIVLLVVGSPVVGAMCVVACGTTPSASPDAADGNAPGENDSATLDAGACAPISIDGASVDPDGGIDPDGGGSCADYIKVPCGLPDGSSVRGACVVDLATCWDLCPSEHTFNCRLTPDICGEGGIVADAETTIECITCPGGTGRRPMGLVESRAATGGNALGAYFASLAHLEEASVLAFEDLARRLAQHGAPLRLRRAAQRAAHDERRHARIMTAFARSYGASPDAARVAPRPEPTLFELIQDNAVEGCVGETYGALLALLQADRAADPNVARSMKRIAADEIAHAALAWEILRWGLPKLDLDDRRRIARAMNTALRALEDRAGRDGHPDIQRVTGHPSARLEKSLLLELRRDIDGNSLQA